MAKTDESGPQQTEFPWAGHVRLTRQQYLYATTRGRLPGAFHDWQCLILARGGSEEDFKVLSRAEKQKLAATTARWNAIPAVQAQIEYERAISLETRLSEPMRAWEARMEKLIAMAAGELPQVRTIPTGLVQTRPDGDGQESIPERVLVEELFRETNLTALAKALEMQGRALSVFKDRQELSGPDGAPAIQVTFVRPET